MQAEGNLGTRGVGFMQNQLGLQTNRPKHSQQQQQQQQQQGGVRVPSASEEIGRKRTAYLAGVLSFVCA